MTHIYWLAAKGVAILHLIFIVFVIAGGLFVLRWPALMWLHVPAAVWGVMIEFGGWYCPLTAWENRLLRRAGRPGYSTGFVNHYLVSIVSARGLSRTMEIGIGLFVLSVNLAVYARIFTAYSAGRP